MKHSTIFRDPKSYCSFPLISRTEDDHLLLGFFRAPRIDHCGIYKWMTLISKDEGESWESIDPAKTHYGWPAVSAREMSDRFTISHWDSEVCIAAGSVGFNLTKQGKIQKSKGLIHRWTDNNWKTIRQRFFHIPDVELIVTFPRHLHEGKLILIPAYALLKEYNLSRCFVWRSTDGGFSFQLINMFPGGVEGNEMAFIRTRREILAHIRSDEHPFLMESWSEDEGKTWSYPTGVFSYSGKREDAAGIVGGPPHLLRLKDDLRILCTYGYRRPPMGIRAIISEDEGRSWSQPIVLREDGGYPSNLRKKIVTRFLRREIKQNPGEDLGYPVSIQLQDESILTVYYITLRDGVTHIGGTKWEV